MAFNKNKYDQKYAKENYDRIHINFKRGEKSILKERANEKGFKHVSDYVKDLIYKDISNSNRTINIENINQTGDNNKINIGDINQNGESNNINF